MNVGGYQIIDLKNHNFEDGVGFIIDGIYDKIKATRKPILVSGVKFEGVELKDQFVMAKVIGSSYKIAYQFDVGETWLQILIADTDEVTVTEI